MGQKPRRVQEGQLAPPAIAVVGWSGSGKTTLIERLVAALHHDGLRVGYLKSHKGAFAMDRPGKDTDRLFTAGAARVAIASPDEGALRFRIEERDPQALLRDHFGVCDLVLVEGFKGSELPKIEFAGDPPLELENVVAVVSDRPDPRPLPCFTRNDVAAIAAFVRKALLGYDGSGPAQ